jgi:large subunit ribosomal protein L25
MRKDITIVAEPRGTRGKNEARRLRVSGNIPAVVYGAGRDPQAVAVNPKQVNKILASATGHNTIFNLDTKDSDLTPVMVVDWQHDPIKGRLLHVDLQRIDLNKRLRVKVPVHTTGEPIGVKVQGGLLEIVSRDVEIEVLPDDIPESFTVDVANLSIGQSVRFSDVALAGSMALMSSPDTVVAHVVAIRTSEEEAPAAEGEAAAPATAEPEVIKKGKKEEVPAAAADEKKKK